MTKEMTIDTFVQNLLNPTTRHCLIRRALEMLRGKWRTQVLYELCKNYLLPTFYKIAKWSEKYGES